MSLTVLLKSNRLLKSIHVCNPSCQQILLLACCRINGVPLLADGYKMHAGFGLITAAECMLRGADGALTAAVGSEGVFQLGIVGADRTGRCFDGTEDVTAYMTGMTVCH